MRRNLNLFTIRPFYFWETCKIVQITWRGTFFFANTLIEIVIASLLMSHQWQIIHIFIYRLKSCRFGTMLEVCYGLCECVGKGVRQEFGNRKATFLKYRVIIKYCISKILRYIPNSGVSWFPLGVSVSVHNGRSNTSTAAELAELRKITTFKGKTQYLMNTL